MVELKVLEYFLIDLLALDFNQGIICVIRATMHSIKLKAPVAQSDRAVDF